MVTPGAARGQEGSQNFVKKFFAFGPTLSGLFTQGGGRVVENFPQGLTHKRYSEDECFHALTPLPIYIGQGA